MEDRVIQVQEGEVTSFIVVSADDGTLNSSINTLLAVNSQNGGGLDFSFVDSLPEGAEGASPLDFFSSLDLPSGENETAQRFYVRDLLSYGDLLDDIADGSAGTRSSGGGGGGGGGGGTSTGTRTGLTLDEIDFDALEREGQRLGLEADRLGVNAGEIAALQGLNAEDRALIEEQYDLQRVELERAYVVQADPARGAANALSAGNFKSGVNGYANNVRRLVQGTSVDRLENARSRTLLGNDRTAVGLSADAARNDIAGQELGLRQDAFNDRLADINALASVSDVAGGGGSFGETVLGGIGLGVDLAGGL